MAGTLALGVDIGGTKVAAGPVDEEGHILYTTRLPMVATGDAAGGFASVRKAIEMVFAECPNAREKLTGIGICSPGPLDPHAGIVINPPNLPCWRDFPLAAELERTFRIRARVENDANAAALAEAIWGAGVGYQNLFYATIGTGIGTGIILSRSIYHGRTGSAAEGGHMSIDYRGPRCACGKRGCVEALCSGPAIAERVRGKLSGAGQASSRLAAALAMEPALLTTEMVGQAFRQGDALAQEALHETADLLVVWLGNVIDLLEPDAIIIGGGIADLMSSFFDRIRRQLPQWSINPRCTEIPLLRAQYGANAGIAGAAALWHS